MRYASVVRIRIFEVKVTMVGKLAKTLLLLIAAVVVLAAAALAGGAFLVRNAENFSILDILAGGSDRPPDINVVEGVKELNELSTVRMTLSTIITREDNNGMIPDFLTGDEVLLIATGDVRAGVDLGKLGRDDVRVREETVTIDLPEPEIQSSGLDEDRTRVYSRDRGVFRLGANDELADQARSEAVDKIVVTARENDILNRAENNAEDGIRAFVNSLGFEEVRFE